MSRALEAVFLVDLVYSSTIVISYVPISSVKCNDFLLSESLNAKFSLSIVAVKSSFTYFPSNRQNNCTQLVFFVKSKGDGSIQTNK